MTASQERRAKPRIKRIGGRWYAMIGSGAPLKQLLLRLVPSIAFCNRMNGGRR